MALVLALLAAFVVGCSDQADRDTVSGPAVNGPDPDLSKLLELPGSSAWSSLVTRAGYPFPDTPDQAVANFRDAYDDEDLPTYAAMLSPHYRFVLQQETIDRYDLPRGEFDASDEIKIAFRMFLGLPGESGYGIGSIELQRLEPVNEWSDVPLDDPDFGGIEGARQRNFETRMQFTTADNTTTFLVEGLVTLMMAPEMTEIDSRSAIAYRFLGGRDHTGIDRDGGTDVAAWGDVKADFH